VVTPDEVLAPDAGVAAPSGRLRDAFLKPPEPRRPRGAPSGMTKDELTHIIKRIDDRERTIAIGSAALGLGVGVALTFAAVHLNHVPKSKTHTSDSFIVYEGAARVVFSAAVVLAAWKRRRSFVAFALLFLGTSMGGIFALPFWAVGIWLIFRVLKWQRELAAMTGNQARARSQARSGGPARSANGARAARPDAATRGRDAAEARRRARAERLSARTAGGRRPKKQPEPTGPPPNKRYTPPKPTRPRPPAA